MWFRHTQNTKKPTNLQQQKFYMWFRHWRGRFTRRHLQQQKFYMWFRLKGNKAYVYKIYNSRNFICGLDFIMIKLTAYIYNSRNFICGLDLLKRNRVLIIYNSRNFICGLDWCGFTALKGSTTVEILYVVQTDTTGCRASHLQQQKFYMWFRHTGRIQQDRIYNSRNFICGLDR